MTMTAITIAPRSEERRETRGCLSPRGVRAYAHTPARRAGRQLGKLLTNNTAGDNDARGEGEGGEAEGCSRLRPLWPNRSSFLRTIIRVIPIAARGSPRSIGERRDRCICALRAQCRRARDAPDENT